MLVINKIDVNYGALRALKNVSLKIKEGEIVALVGSNNAGKSTLLKTISGLIRPASGTITFNDVNITDQPVHKIVDMGISMVPEERKVFRDMTVLENMELGSFIGRARDDREKNLDWLYELFPILKMRTKQKAGTLSGGEQQMLLIARAIMSNPKILLIDELSIGLAPLLTQNIFKSIKELHKKTGLTIVIVEQNVRMALETADIGYIIENGHIVKSGKAKKFLKDKEFKDAYFGIGEM